MRNVMESKSITNKLLLDLIVMIQDYKRWKISEGVFNDHFRKKSDWYEETKRYYSSIPSEYLAKLGLKKNIQDFEKVLNYPVTCEMLNATEEELEQMEIII